MKISRKWSMPNKNTFTIPPIKKIIHKTINTYKETTNTKPQIVDPFANNNKIANITNDLDPQYDTTYHLDATEFLKKITSNSIDITLYDPPYSPRQVSECYKKLNKTVNQMTTSSRY